MLIILGICIGCFILEPIVINFIYFTNIGLFLDIILTRTNEEKLYNYYLNLIQNKNSK